MAGEEEARVRWYPTKMDAWIVALLLFLPGIQGAILVGSVWTQAWAPAAVSLGVLAFLGCLYAGCIFPMRYGIGEEHLIIRFGLCRSRVPIAEIREIIPTHNPLSSPALSLDRLWIQCGDRWYQAAMISPREQGAFIDDLSGKIGLERTARGWKRRDGS
jgi:hypothetical protein